MAVNTIAGRNLGIYVNDVLIGCARTVSLESTASTTTTNCKATGAWTSREYGILDWTASADGIIRVATGTDAAGNMTSENLRDLQFSRTKVELKFEVEGVGNPNRTGMAIITSVSESGEVDGDATFSVSFEGDGELTKGLNA